MKRFTARVGRELRADRNARDKYFAEWHKLKSERDCYLEALDVLAKSTAICTQDANNVARNALKKWGKW